MKRFILTVRTEELRGRMSASRDVVCMSMDAAEKALEREYGVLARRHELTVDEDLSDHERVIEYFPKMRTTLSIKEAN